MEPFVSQLADLCAKAPTRAKWVFVESRAVGRTLGDRLALAGADWANLRFVTPLEIALRMGAPFLVERGVDPSEEGLGPALMMRLLVDLPEERGYFRALVDQPQMAAALWSTLRELRLAGVRSSDLKADGFESPDKHAELQALLASYEAFLESSARGDVATVFEEALRHPDWSPIQAADCWLEQPDVVWSPLQRRLIVAMPGERITPTAIAVAGVTPPRRLSSAVVQRTAPPKGAPLAFLMRPEEWTPGGHDSLTLFHAGGAEAEIEEIVRRVLASGRHLDEVEIVCASPSYPALVWDKAMRYDWPVTMAPGVPAMATRPGRALLAFAEWIEDDFAAGRLRRMLQSGDIAMGKSSSISTGRAARLLLKARAAWGRNTYRLALGRLAASSRKGASRDDLAADAREGLEKRAAEADELAAWIDSVLATVPASEADGKVDLKQIVDCACSFVDRFAARTSALDHLAATVLTDAIGQLRALANLRCPIAQALRFVRERVESVHVGADRPRPGHLHVSTLSSAGFAGRPMVFVAGLEEGRVFPAPFEDPILLDRERVAINNDVQRSSDRTDEAVFVALSRLAAISATPGVEMCLSYSCRDLREYRQTYASRLLLQAYRVTSGNPRATYQALHEHLGAPKSFVPEPGALAGSEAGWWLRGVTESGESSRADVLGRYGSLDAAGKAAEARRSSAFTEFDGNVPAAGAVLDPCHPTLVLSPTQIEDAAACPFRHFLRRGLGVDPIDVGDRDRDVWLDPLLRGTLLHDLFAEFLRRCRAEKRRPALPRDRNWLRERGAKALADLALEMPPPSDEVRVRETQLLLDDLALFAEAEANLSPSRTPVGFEVSFGRADGSVEPLAQADPVEISIGGGLTLRISGRIDRIDEVAPSTFEIVDYKTGGYWPDAWLGTFAGGSRLQHALYGLAALELLKRQDSHAHVAGAEYYFPSAKGQQERKRIPTPAAAKIAEVLNDVREVIASGAFVHAPTEEPCKWCHFGHACGRGAAERASEKVGDPKLDAFRRLVAHE